MLRLLQHVYAFHTRNRIRLGLPLARLMWLTLIPSTCMDDFAFTLDRLADMHSYDLWRSEG